MSWRIAILPCTIEGESVSEDNDRGADWVIPEGDGKPIDDIIDRVADLCAGCGPLRIFTPSATDPRYLRLVAVLQERHCMQPEDRSLYVRPVT